MDAPFSDGTREQIVRTCRATIGDELRHVGYNARGTRVCLYRREDLPRETTAHQSAGARRLGRSRASSPDPRCVEIVVDGSACAVFVCRSDESVCRCDDESLAEFGEVGAAVASILDHDE